jgi:beta-mannosidase
VVTGEAIGELAAELGPWTAPDLTGDVDTATWVFRTTLPRVDAREDDELVLELDGLATRCELRADGELILQSESMHTAHSVRLPTRLDGAELELTVLPLLDDVPSKPRARWRTALVEDGRLRWVRTSLLGRAPSFAPGPPTVGPWRPGRVVRRRGIAVDAVQLTAVVDHNNDGVVSVVADIRGIAGLDVSDVRVEVAGASAGLDRVDGHWRGEVAVLAPDLWWPHGFGRPTLHPVRLVVVTSGGEVEVAAGSVGFRTLRIDGEVEVDGFAPVVNGVPVFVRGAVWWAGAGGRRELEALRSAGLNAIRVVGTGSYELAELHDLCDELGLMVWQDLMLANLDYPTQDPAFRAELEAEVTTVLRGLTGRPSTVAVCGGSEVEQQPAMLGLDPALGRDEWLLELMRDHSGDAVVVPSAPCGGDLPFHPGVGVANYYGVGGYRRPLSDARTSGVRFAAECLAIANLPDDDALADVGVPKDRGTDWDFADVRDHYLAALFDLDPNELRTTDAARYLELSREVSARLMAEVFGEWRRAVSPSHGGFVLWARDLLPGAGWGLLDHTGAPKGALTGLREVCAPLAVWTVDEGLGGVDVHIGNDGADAVQGVLSVELRRADGTALDHAEQAVTVPGRCVLRVGVEQVFGRFVDAGYSYRFGPRGHDAVVVTLTVPGREPLTSKRRIR